MYIVVLKLSLNLEHIAWLLGCLNDVIVLVLYNINFLCLGPGCGGGGCTFHKDNVSQSDLSYGVWLDFQTIKIVLICKGVIIILSFFIILYYIGKLNKLSRV